MHWVSASKNLLEGFAYPKYDFIESKKNKQDSYIYLQGLHGKIQGSNFFPFLQYLLSSIFQNII